MKRKVILNAVVIAVLLALFVVLSLVVDNGNVGKYLNGDGFLMTDEELAAYADEKLYEIYVPSALEDQRVTEKATELGIDLDSELSEAYDTLYVIADDQVVGEYKLTGDMETVEITVDIENCERLAFWLDHNRNSPSYGFFDATLTK